MVVGATYTAVAQKHTRPVPIVGCYSDLREISEGIIGNGVLKIAVRNGKYIGTFAELQNELGLASDEKPLKNITVNKLRLTIKFKLATERSITGKIWKNGIQINWRGNSGSYGRSKSFMKRLGKHCSDPPDDSTNSL